MSGIQGIENLLAAITEYLQTRRPALDPESAQIVSQDLRTTREQVLIAFIEDGIFTENQAEVFRTSRNGNVNRQLKALHKMIVVRERESDAVNRITQNSGGRPVYVKNTINLKNNRGGTHTVSLASLLVNYTGVMAHDGTLQLLVSKYPNSRGNLDIIDLQKKTINYSVKFTDPTETILNFLNFVADLVKQTYVANQQEKFIAQVKFAAKKFKASKTRIHSGINTSSEIVLLQTLFKAKSLAAFIKTIGEPLYKSAFNSTFSKKLLSRLYSKYHSVLIAAGEPGGLNQLKTHLSYLQIEALKLKLTSNKEVSNDRLERMAIIELIISLLEASGKVSSSTQTYIPKKHITTRINKKNASGQANSENINMIRQVQLMNIAGRQAAEAAAAGRPPVENFAGGPSSQATVEGEAEMDAESVQQLDQVVQSAQTI